MDINPRLQVGDTFESAVPTRFQLSRDQAVLRIDGVVLPKGTICSKARGLEISGQGGAHLIAVRHFLRLRLQSGFDRCRLDDPENLSRDGIVHRQPAKEALHRSLSGAIWLKWS
jgi:hypothetical protein